MTFPCLWKSPIVLISYFSEWGSCGTVPSSPFQVQLIGHLYKALVWSNKRSGGAQFAQVWLHSFEKKPLLVAMLHSSNYLPRRTAKKKKRPIVFCVLRVNFPSALIKSCHCFQCSWCLFKLGWHAPVCLCAWKTQVVAWCQNVHKWSVHKNFWW